MQVIEIGMPQGTAALQGASRSREVNSWTTPTLGPAWRPAVQPGDRTAQILRRPSAHPGACALDSGIPGRQRVWRRTAPGRL